MKTAEEKIKLIRTIEKEIPDENNPEMGTHLLAQFIEDGDLDVRIEALKALYQFDKERSLRLLRALALKQDPAVRLKAAITLADISTVESLSVILGMVYDDDLKVRKAVLKKLTDVRNKKSVPSKVFNDKLTYLIDEIRKRERWIIE